MSDQVLDSLSPLPPASSPLQRPRLWTLRGRLGRVEYIVSSLGALVITGLCMSLVGLGMMLVGNFGRMLLGIFSVLLVYCALPILFAMLTIRRAHDFNCGGWLAALLLVPVVNFAFWFIPGTRDENGYGVAPEPPSGGMKLLAALLPVLLLGGFLATAPVYFENKEQSPVQPPAAHDNSLTPYRP